METEENRPGPLPNQFDEYLPWASKQLRIPYTVIIKKTAAEVIISPKSSKSTRKSKSTMAAAIHESSTSQISGRMQLTMGLDDDLTKALVIEALYDNDDNLIQIKFRKNNQIVITDVLKTIYLFIEFHDHLTTIEIISGLNQEGLYILNKILSLSAVTNLILDNTVIPQANYYILLENRTSALQYLSLARCNLQDSVIEILALSLFVSNISALNLTSNGITDVGASYLSIALRRNRTLRYLNLAGNRITDEGADIILSSLVQFPLTEGEIAESKIKYFEYTRAKEAIISVQSDVNLRDKKKSKTKKIDINLMAEIEVKSEAGAHAANDLELIIPFNFEDIFKVDGVRYCYGNNILSYLNLAYNSLTYLSVKKLYKVLCGQNKMNRQPKGLVSVCIEGNNLPTDCDELRQIDNILSSGLPSLTNKPTGKDKKVRI